MNTYKLVNLYKSEADIIASETNLSICLTANGFSFALVDNSQRLRCLGEFEVNLSQSITQVMMNVKACFRSINVHIFNFNKIRIVCQSDKSTWIPYRLYDATKNREYLSVVHGLFANETIIANTSRKLDAVNVFAFPLQVYSGLKVIMPKASYLCPSQIIAEYAFDVASLKQNTLILYKSDNTCSFALFKGSEFVLSNSFTFTNAADLIYFTLNTLQQAGINTGDVCLLLAGDTCNQEESTLLRRYIREVSYANCSENIIVGEEFRQADLQKYFMVLA